MDYAPFEEGTRPLGAPFELVASAPESPLPPWEKTRFKRALLVVAHQDDETLFAGGLIMHYPDWHWTVVTVIDSGRQESQTRALRQLSVSSSYNLGLVDGWRPQPEYRRGILESLHELQFDADHDVVFTHGYRGEYGHHAHVWTHHAVHMLYPNVWDFLHPNTRVKQLRKTLVREVPVTERKRDIFTYSYGSVADSLRANGPWITARMDACEPELFTQAVVGI